VYVSLRDRPATAAGPRTVRRVATTVLLLGVVSLLTDVSSEMVSAVLPLYLTAHLGLGYVAYGLVDGLYQGVSALVRIVGGYAADRSNRPKWVAAAGYGVSALSRIALLPAHGLAAVTAVVTADRLGKGLRTAPRDALIAEASEPGMLGRSFGVHRALDTVGAAIGPLAAFGLLALVPGGYDSVFVVSFAVAMLGLAVIVLFVPDRRANAGTPRVAPGRLLREIASPRLRRPLIAAAVLGVATVADGFLYLSMYRQDDLSSRMFPLLYVGTNLAYLAFAVPFGRLADRIGRARVLVGGHVVLLGVYLVAAGSFRGTAATLGTLVLLGAFYAATDGVLPALVSRLVPAGARGTGIAAAQTVVVVARFGSSLAFGALWVATGPRQALLLMAAVLAVAIALAAWLLRADPRPAAGAGAGPAGDRPRFAALAAVLAVSVGGSTVYVVHAHQAQARAATAPGVATRTDLATVAAGPRAGSGRVALVPLAAPDGPRAITRAACDRVYATTTRAVCLSATTGPARAYEVKLLDRDWAPTRTLPAVPGLSSRARLSRDGSLAATTVFVYGDSYDTPSQFSTRTTISTVDGATADLETFRLVVDDRVVEAADRNFWGVTFADDDRFYATAAAGAKTWLVQGSRSARRLTALREDVECPSLSPDGTRIAFKKHGGLPLGQWRLAVYDLASGTETVLAETRSVDDQAEWLDNARVAYGLPRAAGSPTSDVWTVPADGSGSPRLLVRDAWSPAVVR
jgi:MFS family permease